MKNFTMLRLVAASTVATAIAACGGGDGGDSSGQGSTPALLSTIYTSLGRPLGTCALSAQCSGNSLAPFTVQPDAQTTVLPPNGATLSGFVRLQVTGIALENVELLPAVGYSPRVGVFLISEDKTTAWLDLDTTLMANGPMTLRVSAFNVPAGQPGAAEKIVMSPRTWNIDNSMRPSSATVINSASAPANGAMLSGTVHMEVHGTGISNVELLPAQGYSPRLGQFNVSDDRTFAWLDFDTRSVPDGTQDLRIAAFNVPQGQPGAYETTAMVARRWNFANGASANFSAGISSAPVQGETVRGTVVLEVHGVGMKNIELLPATGYAPLYGRFRVTNDGHFGYLELNTRVLPNGPLTLRVSAFDTPPHQEGAHEIIAMPARMWRVAN